ncbi:uncharacterized protein LOC124285121 [Haliotis rubra]|uniref:uncharacterized protein LOC124285121 n=1 Tax=Haliotis rubra TaxID=36100 RepID=UPI001EE50F30|nr:uncharacterized protein LOC124285121 [Haliotis rubra]
MDIPALAAEKHDLEQQLQDKSREIRELNIKVASHEKTIEELQRELQQSSLFSIDVVITRGKKIKNLFKHYTGVTYVRFLTLLTFLLPQGEDIDYSSGRKDIKRLKPQDALLLTLCRLRHGFGLKDIAVRFGLSPQSAGIIFNTWLDLLYFKLGQIPIWPHRDDIIQHMPVKYCRDYPTTLIIIDGTEVKTQTPCAVSLQSQVYSDYKSSSTLKGLIGCDPNGSLMFVSELFTGSISDKAITEQSGFYDVIKSMKEIGHINEGDGIMVDKGFSIKNEVEKLGLKLNIPPKGKTGKQFNMGENSCTEKVAKHRVHIERLINKVKQYKLLSNCVLTSLFSRINKIWKINMLTFSGLSVAL